MISFVNVPMGLRARAANTTSTTVQVSRAPMERDVWILRVASLVCARPGGQGHSAPRTCVSSRMFCVATESACVTTVRKDIRARAEMGGEVSIAQLVPLLRTILHS